ncbi:MAG: phosphatidate cytidylyltransferase [Alphaproteobacteria bacterium]|nr:phosphatidate cytidylyltransferase [Alphaproteobacteria bacterium]
MVRAVAEAAAGSSGLGARFLSALVLVPLALAAVWLGGWALILLVLAAGLLMLGEWHRMIGGRLFDFVHLAASLAVVLAILLAGLGQVAPALLLLVVALPALAAIAHGRDQSRGWVAFGAFYIGLPAVALIWLREHHVDGLLVVCWVFGVVWTADSGAYAAGRMIGGPKLAPRLSPNKTWSGLIGGILAAAVFGGAASFWWGETAVVVAAAASAVLALAAEMGDLAESAIKRRFGVKDASRLIPGHGGVLDRLDSMLFAAPVAVLLLSLVQGGQVWR